MSAPKGNQYSSNTESTSNRIETGVLRLRPRQSGAPRIPNPPQIGLKPSDPAATVAVYSSSNTESTSNRIETDKAEYEIPLTEEPRIPNPPQIGLKQTLLFSLGIGAIASNTESTSNRIETCLKIKGCNS